MKDIADLITAAAIHQVPRLRNDKILAAAILAAQDIGDLQSTSAVAGMTQKERQERSRKEIYQAALEEFGTYGYDKVNMERICGNHGISKGMMYHYYSNKDELFLLCVERTFQELRAHVERDMAHLSGEDTAAAVKDFFMIGPSARPWVWTCPSTRPPARSS